MLCRPAQASTVLSKTLSLLDSLQAPLEGDLQKDVSKTAVWFARDRGGVATAQQVLDSLEKLLYFELLQAMMTWCLILSLCMTDCCLCSGCAAMLKWQIVLFCICLAGALAQRLAVRHSVDYL